MQNQDNREHDLLDSDDYYQFEGGLAAAVTVHAGRAPALYHNDHSVPDNPRIRTLADELGRVVRARVTNPKWIAGVMRHGYKGAFEIAATVDYLFAFAATTGAVKDHHFDAGVRRLCGGRRCAGLHGRCKPGGAARACRAAAGGAGTQPLATPREPCSCPARGAPRRQAGGTLMANETEAELDRRHAEKMRKRKAARERMLATKTIEKGLLIVHTGKGKGKSTAAFGLAARAIGNGMKVGVVQFVKGKWATGERTVLERFPDLITVRVMGEGFTWDTQDRQRDLTAARKAWEAAQEFLADPSYRLVVLDELNIVLRYDYLDLDAVLAGLAARDPGQHVVVTGRNAKPALIEMADLVTEMTEIKHPFRAGVKAQVGIEF